MAVPSIETRGRSSPQVVWERGRTPPAPAGHQRQSRKLHGRPASVAELYAHEWKREWGSEDAIGFVKDINSIRALREKHIAEARVWASSLGLRADDVRKACLSFPSTTAIGLDQHVFTDIALLTDNALDSLGEIIR